MVIVVVIDVVAVDVADVVAVDVADVVAEDVAVVERLDVAVDVTEVVAVEDTEDDAVDVSVVEGVVMSQFVKRPFLYALIEYASFASSTLQSLAVSKCIMFSLLLHLNFPAIPLGPVPTKIIAFIACTNSSHVWPFAASLEKSPSPLYARHSNELSVPVQSSSNSINGVICSSQWSAATTSVADPSASSEDNIRHSKRENAVLVAVVVALVLALDEGVDV